MSARPRQGTALVLALVLLTALLLLGLPFLFTQSASLGGTRSFAHDRLAQLERDSSANLAAAIAAYTMQSALVAPPASAGPGAWSSLASYYLAPGATPPPTLSTTGAITAAPSPDALAADADGSILVQPQRILPPPVLPPGSTAAAILLGAHVSDESGKLDPNNMSPLLWNNLLAAAHITDWDDNQVYNAANPPPPWMSLDADAYGQLAQALSYLRLYLPGHRITDLEQLLLANPQLPPQNILTPPANTIVPASALRWPLTKAELERLRPVLTLHATRPGRNGLVDLGSVIYVDNFQDQTVIDLNWDPRQPLIANGSVVLSEGALGGSSSQGGMTAQIADPAHTGNSDGMGHLLLNEGVYATGTFTGSGSTNGSAIMLEVPAAMNIHALSLLVRLAWVGSTANADATRPLSKPWDNGPVAVTTIGSPLTQTGGVWVSSSTGGLANVPALLPDGTPVSPLDNLLDRLAPLTRNFEEWPVLGILSAGDFAIDADATITDLLGHQVAQATRRDLIQAIPQEQLLERHWLTQGQWHQLLASRYASQMESWPVAFERVYTDTSQGGTATAGTSKGAPVCPDDEDLTTSPNGGPPATSIRPRPLPTVTSLPPTPTSAPGGHPWLTPVHLTCDWRLPFGARAAGAHDGDAVLEPEELPWGSATPTPLTTPSQLLQPLGAATDPADENLLVALTPDGYHITPAAGAVANAFGYGLSLLTSVTSPGATYATAPAPAATAAWGSFLAERPSSSSLGLTTTAIGFTHEMDARHLELWIQCTSDWNTANGNAPTGLFPIWEARPPADMISSQRVDTASGADWSSTSIAGSNGCQNYFGLIYDANCHLLILAMAPPSIEHTQDSAIQVASMNPADALIDWSTYGPASLPGAAALASLSPRAIADGGLGLAKLTKVWEPNRLLHCVYLPDDSSGQPFFRKNSWHHLQIALASDRPESSAVIVDGIVGSDLAHTATPGTMSQVGDHCTLPALPLAQIIHQQVVSTGDPTNASGPCLAGSNGTAIQITPITIGSTTLTAQNLLPARGMVRIDDEYFAYDHLSPDGKQLQGVGTLGPERGCRQDTFSALSTTTSTIPDPRFPSTQDHQAGAWVTAAGERLVFGPSSGILYTGGCTLGSPIGPGDPSNGNRITAVVDQSKQPCVGIGGTAYVWVYTPGCSLPLQNASTFPVTGPGLVAFTGSNGTFLLTYEAVSGNMLTGVQSATGWTAYGTQAPTWTPAVNNPPIPPVLTYNQAIIFQQGQGTVTLVGIYAQGQPWQNGLYDQRGSTFPDGKNIIALQMPATSSDPGHVEWFAYHVILQDQNPADNGGGFFLCDAPWLGFTAGVTRGLDRTAIPAQDTFPVGTKILPVQTELTDGVSGDPGYLLATGDTVTLLAPGRFTGGTASLLPSQLSAPALQATIRYAATDGFPNPATNAPFADSKNEYFCFTDALPGAIQKAGGLPVAGLEVLVGNCWSADDLTPYNFPVAEPRGYLPRLDLWQDQPQGSTTAGAIYFGTLDPTRSANDTYLQAALNGQAVPSIDCVIDDVSAGPLVPMGLFRDDGEDGGAVNAVQSSIDALWSNGQSSTSIPASGSVAGTIVHAPVSLFSYVNGNMGLVLIDGEVFAYQMLSAADLQTVGLQANTPNYARLVARGLLGSTPSAHTIGQGPTLNDHRAHVPKLGAVRLPIGPVLQLANGSITCQSTASGGQPGSFITLSDQSATGGNPTPATLQAPAAMLVSADGQTMEMVGLIGPYQTNQNGAATAGDYITASWLRGMYGTQINTAGWNASGGQAGAPPLVIGWWPRFPSALPNGALTPQHYRSRAYAWLGLPVGMIGAYFDPARIQSYFPGMPMLPIDADDQHSFFTLQARALAALDRWTNVGNGPAMDWSMQQGVAITPTGQYLSAAPSDAGAVFAPGNDVAGCFSTTSPNGSHQAQPVDGAEVRVTWQYATAPVAQGASAQMGPALAQLALDGGLAPTIYDARVRFLAPIRVLATERSR